ncbi:MAG: Vacuolar protein 8 [Candelina submexicana]|nr:MAG: Vacuolar protein 8 [Candelina submexicana]
MGNTVSSCFNACFKGRSKDALYEPVLADSEREAVADLLQYLENRAETDFFTGEPLRALSTLVYSDNVDLQRSASLTFAEITERGKAQRFAKVD